MAEPVFVALDFETADYYPDSACAVGLAKVRDNEVVDTLYSLLRPPRRRMFFTYIHGITWNDVCDSPTFVEFWPQIADFIRDATCLVAHNASFDRRVLEACCQAGGIASPELPFLCTLQKSRKLLSLPSNKLDDVCRHYGIVLNHHHAGSDAVGAARILIALRREFPQVI